MILGKLKLIEVIIISNMFNVPKKHIEILVNMHNKYKPLQKPEE